MVVVELKRDRTPRDVCSASHPTVRSFKVVHRDSPKRGPFLHAGQPYVGTHAVVPGVRTEDPPVMAGNRAHRPRSRLGPRRIVSARRWASGVESRWKVELEENSRTPDFWTFLMECVGGVPGQNGTWRGPSQVDRSHQQAWRQDWDLRRAPRSALALRAGR